MRMEESERSLEETRPDEENGRNRRTERGKMRKKKLKK